MEEEQLHVSRKASDSLNVIQEEAEASEAEEAEEAEEEATN